MIPSQSSADSPAPSASRSSPISSSPISSSSAGSSAGTPRRVDPLAVLSSLTARDRSVVALLDEHEVLTTDQLARVLFPRLDVAQRRLLRLTRLSVLDRFRWRLPVGSESWHYVLGPIGAELAAASRGVEAPTPAALRKRALRLAGSQRLSHLIGLNGWFCDLAAVAKASPDARLALWWSERRCVERYGALVRPDGAGAYVESGRRVEFFVEYDTGSETLGRVVAKLPRYAELAAAGGPAVPVLIWTMSVTREHHLQELLTRQRVAGLPLRVPVATASAEATAALGVTVAGACWLVPGESERRRLVDLVAFAKLAASVDVALAEPALVDEEETSAWEDR